MTAQEFIALTTKVVTVLGWKDGYYAGFDDSRSEALRRVVISQAKKRKVTHAMIANAYPDNGTYTYEDGVVDFVLGTLTPLTQCLIDLKRMGVIA